MITAHPNGSTLPLGCLDPLTADPDKRLAYRHDTYFREGLAMFEALGAVGALHDITFIVLKPDAIAGRRCRRTLDLLAAAGWHPAAAVLVRFDPILTREVWRYQFNAASDQRIAVVDRLLGSGPSILVLLRDEIRAATPDQRWLPASVRLTAAKGAAAPRAAGGADLRTKIGRINGLFNFVHTADDPADVVRELRLFAYRTGTDWLRDGLRHSEPWSQTSENPALALLPEVEALIPAHDLDAAASVRRLAERGDAWGALARDHADASDVENWLHALADTALPEARARWDVLAILTAWIECNARGVVPLLATARPEDWRAMAGRNSEES